MARSACHIFASSGLLVAVYGIVARVAYGPRLFGFLAVPTVSPFGPFVSKNHFMLRAALGPSFIALPYSAEHDHWSLAAQLAVGKTF